MLKTYHLTVFFALLFLPNIYGKYCLSEDDNPYIYFGTKTPYSFIRMNAGSATDCKPVQFWLLTRHGTRFPKEDDITTLQMAKELKKEVIANYDLVNDEKLCYKDYLAIKNWEYDEIIETKPAYLNEQGWKDMIGLAQRYRMRYPNLLGGNYSRENFYFRHTDTERTDSSCKAFIDGLFGKGANKHVVVERTVPVDPNLNVYLSCEAWTGDVDLSNATKVEDQIFLQSNVYRKLVADVSARLGFNEVLKKEQISSMYDHCRFDKSRFLDQVSPWCSVFTKHELFILEYKSDLAGYHNSGYGHDYNRRLGCSTLSYLRETFEKTITRNKASPKSVSLFAHDITIDMMFTALGYAKDQQKLSGTDFEDLLINRRYRKTFNIPFAANVVAVLHECDQGPEKYKVQFLLNEKPMMLDNCDHGLCNWSYLKRILPKKCDLSFCSKKKT